MNSLIRVSTVHTIRLINAITEMKEHKKRNSDCNDGWLVVLGLTALRNGISVYIGPSPREREKEARNDRREKKMSKLSPAPTASAVGPCSTITGISRTPRH